MIMSLGIYILTFDHIDMVDGVVKPRARGMGDIMDAQRDTLGDEHPATCASAMKVADMLRPGRTLVLFTFSSPQLKPRRCV